MAKTKVKPAIIDYEKDKKGLSTVYGAISFVIFIAVWQISTVIFPNFGQVFPVLSRLLKPSSSPL